MSTYAIRKQKEIRDRKQLSWVPVRRGAVYCSPACGGDCTWAAYLKAKREAEALCRKFPGFRPRVWENLGWHWEIVNNGVFIHPCTPHFFHSGLGVGVSANGRTAKSALRNLALHFKQKAKMYQDALAVVKAATKGK